MKLPLSLILLHLSKEMKVASLQPLKNIHQQQGREIPTLRNHLAVSRTLKVASSSLPLQLPLSRWIREPIQRIPARKVPQLLAKPVKGKLVP
jgi:hypothetical protein